MANGDGGRSTWDRVQMAVTILTGIVGVWITFSQFQISSRQADLKAKQDSITTGIQQLQFEHSTVESLAKYFDYVAGGDTSKAKMGAYAIYMLEKRDPEMVVSLVLASGKPALRDVLLDLGRRDTLIRQQLVRVFSPPTDSASTPDEKPKPASASADAGAVLAQIVNSGWCYVGIHRDRGWTHGPMLDVSTGLPALQQTYVVRHHLYLRAAPPDPRTHRSGNVLGVIAPGSHIQIQEVRTGIEGEHVWVRAIVLDAGGQNSVPSTPNASATRAR